MARETRLQTNKKEIGMSRFVKLAGVTLLGIAVTGSMVFAAGDEGKGEKRRGHSKGDHAARMKELDTDGDGKVSLKEFKVSHKKRMNEMFKHMDSNGDGFLSKEDRPGKGKTECKREAKTECKRKAKGEKKRKKRKAEAAE
jgi:hypothetical protein